MKHKRLTGLLILIIVTSLAQACHPQVKANDPRKTQQNSPEQAATNTAQKEIPTKIPIISPTNTYADLGTIDADPRGILVITDPKLASIATSLAPLETNISSDSEFANKTEEIPTATSRLSTTPPELTETQRPPEPTAFAGCPNGCTYHPPGCEIKGNISISTGEKIYHVPGGEYYDECVINPDYGERWFCTEQEAIDNGWRKSKY